MVSHGGSRHMALSVGVERMPQSVYLVPYGDLGQNGLTTPVATSDLTVAITDRPMASAIPSVGSVDCRLCP